MVRLPTPHGTFESVPPSFGGVKYSFCLPERTQHTNTPRRLSSSIMGAGLAAQRGWPQGQENEPPSSHSTEGTTTSAGDERSASQQQGRDHGGSVGNDLLLYEEVARAEVQPLEDGEYARTYGSAASLTNLVPLDRRQSTFAEENGDAQAQAGHSTSASFLQNDWDSVPGQNEPPEQRDGREMSVAYDLDAVISTEDEVRVSMMRYERRPRKSSGAVF